MSKSQVSISDVFMREPELLAREQKFPGGFVANVHPDNADLMRRAAKQLKIEITEGAPRHAAGATQYIGIYTNIDQHDPQALLQQFFALLIARSNEHNSHTGANHGKPTKNARRRKH